MAPGARQLFPTGIPGLDTLLDGGIPRRHLLTIAGNPGCGKTILGSQIAFLTAARGLSVVVATLTSEPQDKLIDSLSGFTFFRPELLGEQVFFISAYAPLKKGSKEARDLILGTVRERSAKLLFLDGVRAIRDLWQDEPRLREFLYELGMGLGAADCVGLLTTTYQLADLMTLPEATTMDGIVSLTMERHGARRMRRIELVKVRGRAHLTGEHFFEIGSEGIRIIPRLEATIPANVESASNSARAAFGLPELDGLMGGGLPVGSTTMLAGSIGIGKTLLSSYFALEGVRKGEKAFFVSFSDEPPSIAARAQRIGLDVQPSLASGALRFLYVPPVELEVDTVVDRIFAEIARMGARRVVIDGLSPLERSISDVERRHDFLAALSVRLRLAGVTVVFTKEVAKIAGPELDFSDTPIAILAGNLLLLRAIELRGRIHRILSVLKMRDSKYENDLREFEISDQGIRVLAPLHSVKGLLTGQAHPIGSSDPDEAS
jgi:circadian clock protein KaiC